MLMVNILIMRAVALLFAFSSEVVFVYTCACMLFNYVCFL